MSRKKEINKSCPENYRETASFLNRKLRLKQVLKYKNSGRLLDIGCACGFFLKFAEKHFETYGVDNSPYEIARAKNIAANSSLFIHDAQLKHPFEDKFFDVVTLYDVIEHLEDPESAMKEAFRILKHGGYLFIQTPTDKSQKIIPNDGHISLFSKTRLTRLLEKIGFKIVLFKKSGSMLYVNKVFQNLIKLLSRQSSVPALDNYGSRAKANKTKFFLIRKIKLLVWNLDELISKFAPAPEMFVIARR